MLIPFYSFAISASDIYSQANISTHTLYAGYDDMYLEKFARDYVIELVASNIIDYLLDNTDEYTAKKLSINLPNNIELCQDEYNSNINNQVNLDTAIDILYQCKEESYTKNLAYIIPVAATINRGNYYKLLEDIFKSHTKEFVEITDFNIDDFINKMAVYNLLSFNGKPFYNLVTDIKEENIKCENNHNEIDIINANSMQKISNISINGRDFYIKACLNTNSNSYFKYIMVFLKNNDTYSLYERLPIFFKSYNQLGNNYDKEPITININGVKVTTTDKISDDISLIYDYMFYKKGIYLLDFNIMYDNHIINIFKDTTESKYTVTPANMSLILYKNMITTFCKNNSICEKLKIYNILPKFYDVK